MKKHDLSYARHDPAHCLAPNLFRSLKRGERKKFKLDVTYHFGKGKKESMRFVGTELLGADDMRLLQGIVALGGPKSLLLTPEPTTEIGQQLRMFLGLDFEAIKQDGLIVCRSLSKLLTEVGMTDSGDNIKALKASLLRMSNTTILVTKGQQKATFTLMSHIFNEANLWIALNPRIAGAICGCRPHTRIVMAEVRLLQTDPARLMHQRLCGWINPGMSRCIVLDKLCRYIWYDEATNPNTMKTRHRVARKALSELVAVGWTVTEYVKDKWKIKRPAQPS